MTTQRVAMQRCSTSCSTSGTSEGTHMDAGALSLTPPPLESSASLSPSRIPESYATAVIPRAASGFPGARIYRTVCTAAVTMRLFCAAVLCGYNVQLLNHQRDRRSGTVFVARGVHIGTWSLGLEQAAKTHNVKSLCPALPHYHSAGRGNKGVWRRILVDTGIGVNEDAREGVAIIRMCVRSPTVFFALSRNESWTHDLAHNQ